MPARAISSTTISFGLVSIPVKVYTATSARGVRFHLLHDKCGGRVRMQYHCPTDDEVVQRGQLVKGYEVSKDRYVTFTEDELKSLEATRFNALEVLEFVPLDSVDLLYIEKSYYLGPDKGGHKAFALLSHALEQSQKIAVGRRWTRGKTELVLLRAYAKGLLMHQVYYAEEVRPYADVDLASDGQFSAAEESLAQQLIEHLSVPRFDPSKHHDTYAERVQQAAEVKAGGQQVVAAPEPVRGEIVDLFAALKQSVLDAQQSEDGKSHAEDAGERSATAVDKPERPLKGVRKAKPRGARKKKGTAAG